MEVKMHVSDEAPYTLESPIELDPQAVKSVTALVELLTNDKVCDMCCSQMRPVKAVLLAKETRILKRVGPLVGIAIDWKCPNCDVRLMGAYPSTAFMNAEPKTVVEDAPNL